MSRASEGCSTIVRSTTCRSPDTVDRVAVIVVEAVAETLLIPPSTVSAVLTRGGFGRLGRIGLEPAVRYERSLPGAPIHIDIKKLGRTYGGAGERIRGGDKHYQPTLRPRGHRRKIVGWEYVHIAIDDHSQLAYAEGAAR